MRIKKYLYPEAVIEELKAATKEAALEELAAALPRQAGGQDRAEMVRVLMAREKLGSTGIGDGIAIPHGKIAGLNELMISYGRSKKGLDFNSMDGKPVHLLFLLMAPENSSGQHLKVLARISRMLKDGLFRKKLMAAASTEELYRVIVEKDDADPD